VAPYDAASFTAGQHTGTRMASCIARLAARELMQDAHWWNRRRRGAMARALITHADELDNDTDAAQGAPVEVP